MARWKQARTWLGIVTLLGLGAGPTGCVAPGVGYQGGACASCESEWGADPEPWRRYTLAARWREATTCGAGCSERYWGEWWYDPPPPKGCDRCDLDGHWIGPQCADGLCPPGIVPGILGERNRAVCCEDGFEPEMAAPVPSPPREMPVAESGRRRRSRRIQPVGYAQAGRRTHRAAVPVSRTAHERAAVQEEPQQ